MNEGGVCIRGGSSGREAWFEVSCCPPNVARTLASLSSYVATTDADGVQIHQYMAGRIRAELAAGILILTRRDRLPLDASRSPCLNLRIPPSPLVCAFLHGRPAQR